MKVFVSPKEKDYVFKELDQSGVNYIKKEFFATFMQKRADF